jgi:hypothetical protein
MILIEKITKRHLENLRHFEIFTLSKTDGISGICTRNETQQSFLKSVGNWPFDSNFF